MLLHDGGGRFAARKVVRPHLRVRGLRRRVAALGGDERLARGLRLRAQGVVGDPRQRGGGRRGRLGRGLGSVEALGRAGVDAVLVDGLAGVGGIEARGMADVELSWSTVSPVSTESRLRVWPVSSVS